MRYPQTTKAVVKKYTISDELAMKTGTVKTLKRILRRIIKKNVQKTALIERKDSWKADKRIMPSYVLNR
jgi:hypothetical protein